MKSLKGAPYLKNLFKDHDLHNCYNIFAAVPRSKTNTTTSEISPPLLSLNSHPFSNLPLKNTKQY